MAWATGDFIKNETYQIEDVLGRGDFGITYKALHLPSQETVVIKTLRDKLKERQNYDWYVQRFIKESQLLARVCQSYQTQWGRSHPHLVQFREFFQEQEELYLVMDFIEGISLYRRVKNHGFLPEQEAITYIRQIGSALSTLHQAGIVHRDAHPGNMILCPNIHGKPESFQAVLIDLGHAGEIGSHAAIEAKVLGNEFFAAYEQIYQRPGYQKPPVDVHLLAASLYYILTQEYPASCYERRVNDVELVPPKVYNSSLSDQVNDAILKGMAVIASQRPQSIEEWLQEVPGGEEN